MSPTGASTRTAGATMLELDLDPTAVGTIRFAYSPLSEVASSARVLLAEHRHFLFRRWARSVTARLPRTDLEILAALLPAPPRHRAPAFFFDHSESPATDIRAQLSCLALRDDAALRDEWLEAWQHEPSRPAVPDWFWQPGFARRLADFLDGYWDTALAPDWTAVQGVIEADVAARLRRIREHGVIEALSVLHHSVTVGDRPSIRVAKDYVRTRMPRGRVVLVPSVFAAPRLAVATDPSGRFDLYYPVHGIGTIWERTEASTMPGSLAGLLGRSRAQILLHLDVPRSTTDLARRLGHSPGTVSEHLTALRAAGVLTAHRSGRCVYYSRTELAEQLIERAVSSSGS